MTRPILLVALVLCAGCSAEGLERTTRSPTPPIPAPVGEGRAMLDLRAATARPSATLSSSRGVQDGELGSRCWKQRCIDTAAITQPASYLPIDHDAELVLTGDATSVEARVSTPPAGPDTFLEFLDLTDGKEPLHEGPGRYVLEVNAAWPAGDASFTFGFQILEPPEEPGTASERATTEEGKIYEAAIRDVLGEPGARGPKTSYILDRLCAGRSNWTSDCDLPFGVELQEELRSALSDIADIRFVPDLDAHITASGWVAGKGHLMLLGPVHLTGNRARVGVHETMEDPSFASSGWRLRLRRVGGEWIIAGGTGVSGAT